MDAVLCTSGHPSGRTVEEYRPENYFGLRGISPVHGSGSSFEPEKTAELLRGSLKYLEDAYWMWLRKEVLPAIQAHDPVVLSGMYVPHMHTYVHTHARAHIYTRKKKKRHG
jgi:hypothetical protein